MDYRSCQGFDFQSCWRAAALPFLASAVRPSPSNEKRVVGDPGAETEGRSEHNKRSLLLSCAPLRCAHAFGKRNGSQWAPLRHDWKSMPWHKPLPWLYRPWL